MSIYLDEALHDLKLNEAFSDSMPSWMRQSFQKASKGTRQRYNSRYEGERNLLQLIIKAGYDPSAMSIISKDKPSSFKDPIFDDPDYIPVLHVVSNSDDIVWIYGINDEALFSDKNGRDRKLQSINNDRQLAEYITDFAVIDVSNADTNIPWHVIERDPVNKDKYSGKEKMFYGAGIFDQDPTLRKTDRDKELYGTSGTFDKSGYYRGGDVISDRLKNKLKEATKSLLPKKLLAMEQEIKDLYPSIVDYISNIDDVLDRDKLTTNENIMQNFQSIVYNYKDISRDVASQIDAGYPLADYYLRIYKKLKIDLESLKKIVSQYERASFVW